MADKKISQLTALSAANLAPSTDVLAIVDTSATETKKIVAQDLINGVLNVASAVGIGTASPASKLDTAGTIRATSQTVPSSGTGAELFYDATNAGLRGYNRTGSAYVNLALNDNVYIGGGSSGNVGIGTASPSTKLTVYDATTPQVTFNNGTSSFIVGNNSGGNNKILYGTGAYPMIFYTNATEAMRIDASQNLFCGGTTGSSRLNLQTATNSSTDSNYITLYNAGENVGHINWINGNGDLARITGTKTGTGASANDGILTFSTATDAVLTERGRFTAGGYFKASNDGGYIDATASYHELRSTGNDATVVIANTNASLTTAGVTFVRAARNTTNNTFYAITYYNAGADLYRFRVADSGDCTNTNGTYAAFSDIKLKQDIVDAASQWDDIKNLRVRKYRLKSDLTGPMQLGLVAQEAETVSPGLIDEHADRDAEGNDLGTTTKSVKYSILYMKAVKALQEAMARIESLEADVAALKGAK